MPFHGNLFDIIGADETVAIAHHEMTLLGCPAFPADAVIHDAACGLGAVTKSILATSPAPTIKIHATDIAPPMTGTINQSAEANHWPCRAEIMGRAGASLRGRHLHLRLPVLRPAYHRRPRRRRPRDVSHPQVGRHGRHGLLAAPTRRASAPSRCAGPCGAPAPGSPSSHPQHSDRGYIKSLLVEGGSRADDFQVYEHSALLAVRDVDELANAIWSAIGRPRGGWTEEDDEQWDEVVAKYKELLPEEPGYQVDGDGNVTLKATVQIVIAREEGRFVKSVEKHARVFIFNATTNVVILPRGLLVG